MVEGDEESMIGSIPSRIVISLGREEESPEEEGSACARGEDATAAEGAEDADARAAVPECLAAASGSC